jgi:hypothetical protein
MREYDEAIGQIAACCSTVGANFRGYSDKRGTQYVEVTYRNGVFTLVLQPSDSYVRAISARRLSNLDGFDITRSQPIVEVEEEIADLFDGLLTTNIRIDYLTETAESTGIEYFDGFRTTSPLYVFEDSFGPQTFDESLAELNQLTRKAFSETIDHLELDIENPEATTGSEDEPERAYEPAFQ